MYKSFMTLLAILTMLITVLLASGCGDTKTAEKIIVGVDNNPPYTFVNQPISVILNDGDGMSPASVAKEPIYDGFDVDVITAVAKKAGLSIEFRDMAFGKMFEQIENGKNIDIAIGGVSITDERKKHVDFTMPYANGGACIVAFKNDNIASVGDLAGKIVGAELNTTMIQQTAAIKGAKIRGYQNQQDMFIDLFNGDLDALVMDKLSAEYALRERKMKRLKIVNMLSNEEFGMVVKKGNTQLTDKLNKALDELKKSGELKKIYDKWFSKQ